MLGLLCSVTSEFDVSTKVEELGLDVEEMRSLEVDNAVGIQIVSPEVSLPTTSVVGLLYLCIFSSYFIH